MPPARAPDAPPRSAFESVGGFKILPVLLEDGTVPYSVYFKEHTSHNADATLPAKRTIFVANMPADTVREVFGVFGKVEAVRSKVFTTSLKNSQGISSAVPVYHVVFEKSKSLENCLALKGWKPFALSQPQPSGLEKWEQQYELDRPDIDALEAEINRAMSQFDAESAQARARLLEASKADEQGWMTVVNTGTEMKAVSENPAYEKKKQLKAQKTQEVETIYRFQRREIQKEKIAELRRKFDEDKLKVAKMRASRKFKPY